ncbi:MAG: PorT family protein [Chitinophagales bacterium]|nr:PorT family protein [Chitinophagales bacterium]
MNTGRLRNFLILICLVLFWNVTWAQVNSITELRFRAGIVLGLNATQVDGDDYAGYHKLGLNGGFTAQLPVSKKFFFSTEILYSQKGAKSRTFQGVPLAYRTKLNYAEIPLLFNFQEKHAVNFGLGVSYGRLIKVREYIDGIEQDPFEDFRRNDIAGVANGNYLISDHLQLNLRFAYSLIPIGYSPTSNFNSRAMFNNILSFRLAYVL